MAALVRPRVGSIQKFTRRFYPVGANVNCIKGGLAACDLATGNIVPATNAPNLKVIGRFRKSVDNTGGAAGARKVEVEHFEERTAFLLLNDTTTPVTNADRFQPCYQLDDQTVTADPTGTSVAGQVIDVTAEGVWVEVIR